MKRNTVNISRVLCCIVLFMQLIWLQKNILFPSIPHSIYVIIYYMKYFGSFILLIYTIYIKKETYNKKVIKKYIYIFLPVIALFTIIELFALINSSVVKTYGFSYWSRAFSYFLDKLCIFINLSCIFLLCKKHTMRCISNTLIVNEVLILAIVIIRCGIWETLKSFLCIIGILEGNTATKLLEVHELTYCIGLCLIYYMFFSKTKENKKRIFILIIFFFLGGKRIGFLGIVISGLFALFVYKKGLTKKGITFFGIIITVICIFYINTLYDGEFVSYMSAKGIDLMGRDVIYNYFTERTNFSLKETGLGISAVSMVLDNLTKSDVGNIYMIRGLHNDILKIYIECGFWGFVVWLLINLVYIPKKIYTKLGKDSATVYFSLIIFAFITYLTDNTENYFVFQTILFIIPLVINNAIEERRE